MGNDFDSVPEREKDVLEIFSYNNSNLSELEKLLTKHLRYYHGRNILLPEMKKEF